MQQAITLGIPLLLAGLFGLANAETVGQTRFKDFCAQEKAKTDTTANGIIAADGRVWHTVGGYKITCTQRDELTKRQNGGTFNVGVNQDGCPAENISVNAGTCFSINFGGVANMDVNRGIWYDNFQRMQAIGLPSGTEVEIEAHGNSSCNDFLYAVSVAQDECLDGGFLSPAQGQVMFISV